MFKIIHRCYTLGNHFTRNLFNTCKIKSTCMNRTQFVRPISCENVGNDGVPNFDIVIVGAGIIGSSTALHLKQMLPDFSIAIVDKEDHVAAHQSSHNSGVIHAGIYYKPGSLRAKLCVSGMLEMYKYCDKYNIPYDRNGKLIVATTLQEVQWLIDLHQRGLQNHVPGLEMIPGSQIKEIEPYCEGLRALNSPYTGIINFGDVARSFVSNFRELGGKLFLNFKVKAFEGVTEGGGSTMSDTSRYPITVTCDRKRIHAGFVLTCCGLQADEISVLTKEPYDPRIVPFRGTYYILNPEKNHMVKGNIYPVPDPNLPFPGVHFTPKLDGSIWCGPTAMIGFRKESYDPFDVDVKELIQLMKFRGLRLFVYKYFRRNVIEFMKSTSNASQLVELQKYIPSLKATDLCPGPAGVQAQAMDSNGNLVEDFAFHSSHKRILHCRNSPSPAATSSITIGKYVSKKVKKILKDLDM